MAMEYYASQDVFDYDVRQRPNTALHQIHAHVRYIFSSHVISAKNKTLIKYTTRVKIEQLLLQLPALVMVDAKMEEDALQVVDVNVNMGIKEKDVSCQERWVRTTM